MSLVFPKFILPKPSIHLQRLVCNGGRVTINVNYSPLNTNVHQEKPLRTFFFATWMNDNTTIT